MTAFINALTIEGFKAFKEPTSFSFGRLTVFAGANSVGKSSVIQALLISRVTMEQAASASPQEPRIALNGPYLLALGNTQQVATTSKVKFDYAFTQQKKLSLDFHAPPDDNYLVLKKREGMGAAKLDNVLAAPNFHYLNAERIGPRPLYVDSVQTLPSVGCQGELAVQLLSNRSEAVSVYPKKNVKSVSDDPYNTYGLSLLDQTKGWMEYLLPGSNFSANRLRELNYSRIIFGDSKSTPPNVGFGVSYVLPIVVAGLIAEEGSLFIVENPEAHLHPSGQSRIGQFLGVMAAAGVQVVVETHSEHVINGIRIAVLKRILRHEDVAINFLSRNSYNIDVNTILLDAQGDLSDFPPGFFDQLEQDLISISQIRRRKK